VNNAKRAILLIFCVSFLEILEFKNAVAQAFNFSIYDVIPDYDSIALFFFFFNCFLLIDLRQLSPAIRAHSSLKNA